jgi:hypothetical protein
MKPRRMRLAPHVAPNHRQDETDLICFRIGFQCRAVVNTVMNYQVTWNVGKILRTWATGASLRRAQPHGVSFEMWWWRLDMTSHRGYQCFRRAYGLFLQRLSQQTKKQKGHNNMCIACLLDEPNHDGMFYLTTVIINFKFLSKEGGH